MSEPALLGGIDIGGTKIAVCVGTADGRVLGRHATPMDRAAAPESVLNACRDKLAELAGGRDLAAVGAACPGPISYAQGRFLDPPNMPAWHGFRLRDWLAGAFTCPAAMMNDANALALAEWLWGAARGTRTAVFLTMSTGMGAGLIIDGRLHEGPLGLAGEIGHIRLREDGPVGFGKRGSVEGFLSGPGMVQLARSEAMICEQTGESTRLRDGPISVERLCEAARAGDPAARRVTDRVALELGRLLAILTDVLNPEVFVLGTIGTAHPDLFIPGAVESLKREAIPHAAATVRVVPSALPRRGDQSALAVAAGLLRDPNGV